MVTDNTIDNFMISSNDIKFGDFDDIVIELKQNNIETRTALQLKHSNDGKTIPIQSFTHEKGDFSISKYLKSFKEIRKISNCHQVILFTNRKLDLTEEQSFTFRDFRVKIIEQEPSHLLNSKNNGKCYKFETKNLEIQQFFANFLLYTNQASVTQIEKITLDEFQKIFCCPKERFDAFLQFISKWSLLEGNKEKLDKFLMKRVIALEVLSPFIKPYSNCSVNDNTKLLRQTMADFDVTVFQQENYDRVAKIWGDAYDKIRQNFEKANRIRIRYQLDCDLKNLEESTKVLWLMDEVPLIVTHNRTTFKVLEVCKNQKFIVIGDDFFTLQNCSIFRNVSDLNPDCDILKKFEYSIQQKACLSLEEIEEKEIVTTDILLQMLEKPYCFGEEKETLPAPIIERFLTRNTINIEYLNTVDSDTVIVINCQNNIDKLARYLPKFNVMQDSCFSDNYYNLDFRPRLILHKNDYYPLAENMHQFSLTQEGNLEWIASTKKITDLKQFRLANFLIEETHIFNNPNTKLIIGEAGIGKSIFVKNLKNNILPKFWTIILYSRDISLLFQRLKTAFNRISFEKFILEEKYKSCKNFDRKFLEMLMKRNEVVYIWEAIDELTFEEATFVVNSIRSLSRNNMWIISRPHLQNYLEVNLNILGQTLVPFNNEQKIVYITKRLKKRHLEQDIIDKIQMYINQEILDTPLHIYMFTELLQEDLDKYMKLAQDLFNETLLYEHWIEEKISVYYHQNFGDLYPNRILIEHKKYLYGDYQQAALRLLVPQLTTRCDEFLEKIRLEGDPFGIITDEKPTFFHYTIAEYFVAKYFSQNLTQVPNLVNILFDQKNKNIRYFFDVLLAQSSPPHIAVFYNNVKELRKYGDKLKDFKDLGGRNVLHLACSWGQSYPIFEVEKIDSVYFISTKPKTLSKESPQYEEMIYYLLENLDYSECDTLFSFSSLDYAKNARCLFTKMIIQQKFLDFEEDQTMASVLYNCGEDGYEKVIDFYEKFPVIKVKQDHSSYLHICVPYENFLSRLLLFDDYMKLINDTNTSGDTPLHKACEIGYYNSVVTLLQHQAEYNVTNNKGYSPLHLSSLNGHESIVKLLLQIDADVQSVTKTGFTALHLACYKGYETIVKLLVEKRANLDVTTVEGCSPLLVACQCGHDNIVKMLIEHGASFNATSEGWSTLHTACNNGHETVVKLLIEAGNTVSVVSNTNVTPLHLACHEGHESIANLLIELNSDVDAVDTSGLTPLHLASHRNFLNIVKKLISLRVKIDRPDLAGLTLLHWACDNGHDKIVELLINSGADIEAVTKLGKTSLHLACYKGYEAVVKLLLASGAKTQVITNKGFTPFHLACQEGHDRIVKLLIDKSDINFVTKEGSLALHWACYSGHYSIVKILIQSGTNIEIPDSEGSTPLLLACHQGFENIVKHLIHFGANIATPNLRGFTPVHWASQEGYDKIVKILLDSGADTSVKSKRGSTPLHLACQKGHTAVVKLLIFYGTNIEAGTDSGWTPLHWASFKGQDKIVKLLLEAGANVDAVDDEGLGSLHLACSKGFVSVVNILMEFGANIGLRDKKGYNCLHIACQDGQVDVVELLLGCGIDLNGLTDEGKTPLQIARECDNQDVVEVIRTCEGSDETTITLN